MNIQSVSQNSFVPPANAAVLKTVPTSSAVTDSQQASDTKSAQPSNEELRAAVKSVSETVKNINNSLSFSIDDSTGQTVVRVVDNDTQEVIKQIPSKEMLALAKALDQITGLLVKQKA